MELTNKRVMVLGGTSEIGLAVAEAAAKAGATIVMALSRQDSVDRVLAQLPRPTEAHRLDLHVPSRAERGDPSSP